MLNEVLETSKFVVDNAKHIKINIEKNFLLNFSFIILAIFLPHNSDITIGLMGSYLFFIITGVYEEYRNEIGNNIEYNRKNIRLQLLLNISLCNSFILIEKSISMIYSNNFEYPINPFVFAINILITIILIALNYFLSNNEEKKTPLKQKIKIFTSTCISKK